MASRLPSMLSILMISMVAWCSSWYRIKGCGTHCTGRATGLRSDQRPLTPILRRGHGQLVTAAGNDSIEEAWVGSDTIGTTAGSVL
jgi:hypothetical protein